MSNDEERRDVAVLPTSKSLRWHADTGRLPKDVWHPSLGRPPASDHPAATADGLERVRARRRERHHDDGPPAAG